MQDKYDFCAMQILLVSATANEIELFINKYNNVDIFITGVGVPATLYNLQKRLFTDEYDFVIQAGVAGAFATELQLGQTVFVKQDAFGDLGIEENKFFTPLTSSGFANTNNFPYADGWLINGNGIPKDTSLKCVKAVTVNKVTDDVLQKEQLIKAFNPQIETMEGAALHYVCLQEEIPFLQIRTISNYVGERNKMKWQLTKAFENLNTQLQTLLNQLTD
jgi:futalosine hydrolase